MKKILLAVVSLFLLAVSPVFAAPVDPFAFDNDWVSSKDPFAVDGDLTAATVAYDRLMASAKRDPFEVDGDLTAATVAFDRMMAVAKRDPFEVDGDLNAPTVAYNAYQASLAAKEGARKAMMKEPLVKVTFRTM